MFILVDQQILTDNIFLPDNPVRLQLFFVFVLLLSRQLSCCQGEAVQRTTLQWRLVKCHLPLFLPLWSTPLFYLCVAPSLGLHISQNPSLCVGKQRQMWYHEHHFSHWQIGRISTMLDSEMMQHLLVYKCQQNHWGTFDVTSIYEDIFICCCFCYFSTQLAVNFYPIVNSQCRFKKGVRQSSDWLSSLSYLYSTLLQLFFTWCCWAA